MVVLSGRLPVGSDPETAFDVVSLPKGQTKTVGLLSDFGGTVSVRVAERGTAGWYVHPLQTVSSTSGQVVVAWKDPEGCVGFSIRRENDDDVDGATVVSWQAS